MPDDKNTTLRPETKNQNPEKRSTDFSTEKVVEPNESKRPPQPSGKEKE